jgi:hypothetical protein
MKATRDNFRLILLVLLLILPIAVSSACERGATITIYYQSNQDVTIYYSVVDINGNLEEPTYQGIVPAHSTKTQSITLIDDTDVKKIEVKDQSGKVVFSHYYNRDDLEKIDGKITILQ